jgi:hypothetical protein
MRLSPAQTSPLHMAFAFKEKIIIAWSHRGPESLLRDQEF